MKELLALSVGCLVGIAIGFQALPNVQAQPKTSYYYRIIDENNGEKIERDLNSLTRSQPGCRPILAIAPNEYGKAKVILECEGT